QEQKRAAEREAASRTPPTPTIGAAGATPASGAAASAGPGPARGRAGSPSARGARAMPEASFPTTGTSLLTQALLYLRDRTPRGVEPQVNLDMARFNVDLLGVIEQKSKGNLSDGEQKLLDNALYETRMRFVSVASQYATV